MLKAVELFTARPKRHNCAQAVMEGAGGSPEAVAAMAACGTGKAPEGLCGALHAALTLCPEHTEEIKAAFIADAGALTCHEIKSDCGTPCEYCVETAAKAVETYQASRA